MMSGCAARIAHELAAPDQVWRARHDLRFAGAGERSHLGRQPRSGRSSRLTIPTPPQDRPGYYDKAGWVLDQPPEVVRKIIRDTWGGFYQHIPEMQPGHWPWQQLDRRLAADRLRHRLMLHPE